MQRSQPSRAHWSRRGGNVAGGFRRSGSRSGRCRCLRGLEWLSQYQTNAVMNAKGVMMSQKMRPSLSMSFHLAKPIQRHSTPTRNAFSARASRKNLLILASRKRVTPVMISDAADVGERLLRQSPGYCALTLDAYFIYVE